MQKPEMSKTVSACTVDRDGVDLQGYIVASSVAMLFTRSTARKGRLHEGEENLTVRIRYPLTRVHSTSDERS